MQTRHYGVHTEIMIAIPKQLKRNYLMDRCFVHSLLWLQQHSTLQRAQASPVGRQMMMSVKLSSMSIEH